MVKTGYARQLQAVAVASRPPPTRAQHEARLVRLARFVARGVSPATCYSRDKRPWRGNFDPLGKDPGLSTDTPTISSIDKFVRTAQLPRQLSLQLRVMVLETKIYTSARKAYEVTLNRKYVGVQKLHFREWAGCTQIPEGTAFTAKTDMPADSWAQYDREPDLAIVKPELSRIPPSADRRRPYPPLLKAWWEHGFVGAQIIDPRGMRTRCEFWQLPQHLEHRSHVILIKVKDWALEAERLKAELCMIELEQDTVIVKEQLVSDDRTLTLGGHSDQPNGKRETQTT